MNMNDKDFFKSIIQDDLRTIPNPSFTSETVLMIKELRNAGHKYQKDFKFIYPVFIFTISVIIISILRVFNILVLHDQILFLNELLKSALGILFNPITISIGISVFILYYLDSYLYRLKIKHF